MPILSMFYGIIVRMFYFDTDIHAWIEIHRDDLMADWKLAVDGQKVFKIQPLR